MINNVELLKTEEFITNSELGEIEIAKEILRYLFSQKKLYPLFFNVINKIEEKINLDKLNFEELSKVILEIVTIYHCNSKNGNLKGFGLGERIGRLSGNNINKGCFKFMSVTGLKVIEYEF